VRPDAHAKLLALAAEHPLASVHRRARDLLAVVADDPNALTNAATARPPLTKELRNLVAQLTRARTPAEAEVLTVKQRDSGLVELALGTADSAGCYEYLRRQIEQNENALSAYYLLANNPRRIDSVLAEAFFNPQQQRTLIEQPLLNALGLHDDHRGLSNVRWLGVGDFALAQYPPLLHRKLALQTLSDLDQPLAAEFLAVVVRDPNALIQTTAALAFHRSYRRRDPEIESTLKVVLADPMLSPTARRTLLWTTRPSAPSVADENPQGTP
ncbi:MAG: hypothetical protein ACRDD1_01070, partial [Planctomycetia bacterium]